LKRKLKSLIIISSPILLVGSTLGTVYALKMKNNVGDNDDKSNPINPEEGEIQIDNDDNDGEIARSRFNPSVRYKKSEIFPDIKVKDIYDYIKVEKGVPVFDKEIVARLVKIVVSGLGVTFGELNFEYQFKSKQHLLFEAQWFEQKDMILLSVHALLVWQHVLNRV